MSLENLEATAPMESGITTIEQAEAQVSSSTITPPSISAKDALGLDESPRESLKRENDKVSAQVPKETMPRDDTGRFVKPGKKSGEAVKPTTPPEVKPPGATAPAKPAEPSKPAEPAAPAKIKIGDKEYSVEELTALLNQKQQPARPEAAPAPQAAPPAVKSQTPEEIATLENEFIAQLSAGIPDVQLTEEALEKILVGGKEGIATLNGLLKGVAARSILEARKSIYAELNPVVSQLSQQVSPLIQNNQQLERHATEMAFVTRFPEYSGENLGTARYVAEQLVEKYPQAVAQMDREQFLEEVNRQADKIIAEDFKRWHSSFNGTWKDWSKSQSAPPTTAPAPTTAAPTLPPAATIPAKPAAPKPTAKPPSSNSPGNVTGAPKDWQRGVAGSLAI
jgi:hypothetical protein